MTTVERSATTLGPATVGLRIAVIGGWRLLWLVAALFTSASLFVRTYLNRTLPAAADRSYRRELRDGAAFLVRDRSLAALPVMYAVTDRLDVLCTTARARPARA